MVNRISLSVQAGMLRSYFPDSFIYREGENSLVWKGFITPSQVSNTYRIKLNYKRFKYLKITVVDQVLQLAKDKTALPHVYSTPLQELCLYYPENNEWDEGKLFVNTLIPWASEWLYHYEFWLYDGIWRGGGIEH